MIGRLIKCDVFINRNILSSKKKKKKNYWDKHSNTDEPQKPYVKWKKSTQKSRSLWVGLYDILE